MRYQICYAKKECLTAWKDTFAEAAAFAKKFQKAGFTVSVWEHTSSGSRMIDIDTGKPIKPFTNREKEE